MSIDENKKWKSHVIGKVGLATSLHQRLYSHKKAENHLPKTQIRNVEESIWTSKLRYGLQIWAEVRMTGEQPVVYFDQLSGAART